MLSRRTFLTAAGTAALAPGQTRKIRAGILGVQHSHLGGKVQAMLDNPAYEVVAVAEPDPKTRAEHQGDALLKGLRWVSMDELISDKSIDLVVFEGEVKDAVPFGARVLEAGKHLHLEKPPVNKLPPFRKLVETARRKKLHLQLGYLWRHHAGTNAALEAYRNGWLGEVYLIRATINADRDQKQRDVEARFPGGTMFELGGHMVDRVVACMGRPTDVRTWLRHDTSVADEHRDNTLAVFAYPKTLAVIMSAAKDPASNEHRSFEMLGTDGSVLVQPMEPAPVLRIWMREDAGPYKKGVQEIKLPRQPRFVRDFEELAKSIQTGEPLKYSYDHELLLHETLLRAAGDLP